MKVISKMRILDCGDFYRLEYTVKPNLRITTPGFHSIREMIKIIKKDFNFVETKKKT